MRERNRMRICPDTGEPWDATRHVEDPVTRRRAYINLDTGMRSEMGWAGPVTPEPPISEVLAAMDKAGLLTDELRPMAGKALMARTEAEGRRILGELQTMASPEYRRGLQAKTQRAEATALAAAAKAEESATKRAIIQREYAALMERRPELLAYKQGVRFRELRRELAKIKITESVEDRTLRRAISRK